MIQKEIDKAGTGDFRLVQPGIIHLFHNSAGNQLWGFMGDARRLHSNICRKIAKLLLGRYFEHDFGVFSLRQRARPDRSVQSFLYALLY